MNAHTIEGEKMLEQVGGLLGEVGALVRLCHEHYDGSGYPDGLSGDAIPLVARIVCCCDAFHAMTSGPLLPPSPLAGRRRGGITGEQRDAVRPSGRRGAGLGRGAELVQ